MGKRLIVSLIFLAILSMSLASSAGYNNPNLPQVTAPPVVITNAGGIGNATTSDLIWQNDSSLVTIKSGFPQAVLINDNFTVFNSSILLVEMFLDSALAISHINLIAGSGTSDIYAYRNFSGGDSGLFFNQPSFDMIFRIASARLFKFYGNVSVIGGNVYAPNICNSNGTNCAAGSANLTNVAFLNNTQTFTNNNTFQSIFANNICYGNGTGCIAGGNSSWNESYANGLYAPISLSNSTSSGKFLINQTICFVSSCNLTYNNVVGDSILVLIKGSANVTSVARAASVNLSLNLKNQDGSTLGGSTNGVISSWSLMYANDTWSSVNINITIQNSSVLLKDLEIITQIYRNLSTLVNPFNSTNVCYINNSQIFITSQNFTSIGLNGSIASSNYTGYASQVVCYMASGSLGHCTSIVGVTGACTCANN